MTVVGREVPDVCVKLVASDVASALHVAICAIVGRAPSASELCCHVAQSALETGHWKSCHCNNLGNVKASADYPGDITYFGCNEVLSGKVKWFHPALEHRWGGHNAWVLAHPQSTISDSQCRWRAFATLEAGAAAQMQFFQRRPRSFAGAMSGNPRTFAHALKLDRYYTAHEEDYYVNGKLQRGYAWILESVFGKYLPLCKACCTEFASREAAMALEPVSVEIAQSAEYLPMAQDPDVDQTRSAMLSHEHIDEFSKTLSDMIIEIPWGDYDEARRKAVLELNEE